MFYKKAILWIGVLSFTICVTYKGVIHIVCEMIQKNGYQLCI